MASWPECQSGLGIAKYGKFLNMTETLDAPHQGQVISVTEKNSRQAKQGGGSERVCSSRHVLVTRTTAMETRGACWLSARLCQTCRGHSLAGRRAPAPPSGKERRSSRACILDYAGCVVVVWRGSTRGTTLGLRISIFFCYPYPRLPFFLLLLLHGSRLAP